MNSPESHIEVPGYTGDIVIPVDADAETRHRLGRGMLREVFHGRKFGFDVPEKGYIEDDFDGVLAVCKTLDVFDNHTLHDILEPLAIPPMNEPLEQ